MASTTAQEGAGAPAAQRGSWMSFLKSLASYNGDIASLTAPPFILGTISLTEFSSYWAEHPSVFVAPAAEQDPAKRAMLVLKWFLSTLKQQYCTRSENQGSEKKPLNPFLGELFLGKWVDASGETRLVSEQVSHHPPVTAYNIWNDTHGVRLQGYNGQKVSFSKTIHVRQVGHAVLHIDAFNEDYLITLPPIHIEGLIFGSPFVELNKTTYITSSSGFISEIDYSGKGWVSGKKNSFSAKLYPTGKPKDVLYSANGRWNEAFEIREGSKKDGKLLETFVSATAATTPLTVAPIADQDELEAKRAWAKVVEAIKKGDMDAVHNEKSKIENSQRDLRKKEKETGKEWERTFFSRVESSPVFDKLAPGIKEQIEADKTNGIWRFDETKAKTATKPYGKSNLPTGLVN